MVSFVIEKLTVSGVVTAVNAQLEELVPDRANLYPAEEQAYLLLEEFLADQNVFVRQLQELVEIQTSIEVDGTLFRNDMIEIFGNARQLTSMHIALLVRMEQNLFLPFSNHRWTDAFQFYLDYVSEESEFVANERNARAKIRLCIDKENTTSGNPLSIPLTKCLRILPLPAQRLSEYSTFLKVSVPSILFRGITADHSQELSSIESLSSSQGPGLKLARANLGQAMTIVNDRVRSEETSEAFTELKRRVEDWRGHNPTNFGTLLLYDSVIITKDKIRRPVCFSFPTLGHVQALTLIVPCISLQEHSTDMQRIGVPAPAKAKGVSLLEEHTAADRRPDKTTAQRPYISPQH